MHTVFHIAEIGAIMFLALELWKHRLYIVDIERELEFLNSNLAPDPSYGIWPVNRMSDDAIEAAGMAHVSMPAADPRK